MNKIYRVVFNHATQTWTAVAEFARAKGKSATVDQSAAAKTVVSGGGGKIGFTPKLLTLLLLSGLSLQSQAVEYSRQSTYSVTEAANEQNKLGTLKVANVGVPESKNTITGEYNQQTGIYAQDMTGTQVGNQKAVVTGYGGTAYGSQATATGHGSTAVGAAARALKSSGVALGQSAYSDGDWSTSIGRQATTTKANTIAVGTAASAVAESAISVGTSARAEGQRAIAIGAKEAPTDTSQKNRYDPNANTQALGEDSIALGTKARTTQPAKDGIAIGHETQVEAEKAIAVGTNTLVHGAGSGAFGSTLTTNNQRNTVNGSGSFSIGNNNLVNANNTVVFGSNINTQNVTENSVFLGDGSSSNGDKSTVSSSNVSIDNTNITFSNYAGATPKGIVTVGSAGNERRIQNVAAGNVNEGSTDAINGSQLYSTNQALGKAAGSIATHLGGNSSVNTDGSLTAPTYTLVKGKPSDGQTQDYNNVGEALSALNSALNQSLTFKGNDNSQLITKKLGDTLTIKGGATTNGTFSGKNTKVVVSGDDSNKTLEVQIAENPEFNDLKTNKLTVEKTSTFKDTITAQKGINITNGNLNVQKGNLTVQQGDFTQQGGTFDLQNGVTVKMGNNKITEVADGKNTNDAVNFRQLTEVDNKAQAAQTTADNALAKANEGFKLQANGQDESTVTPGSIVNIKNGKNIQVTKDGNNITIATSDAPTFSSITTTNGATIGGKVTANELQTTNGATIGGKLTANQGLDVKGGNITMNDGKITGLKAGEQNTDAVNKGQLDGVKTALETQLTNKTTEITNTLTNKGTKYQGDDNQTLSLRLGETLNIKGGVATNDLTTVDNIGVVKGQDDSTLNVKLAKDLKGLESVTTGTLTATGAITQGPNDKRIVINNGKITGLSETPTVDDDAANKKYVDDQNNKQNVGLKDLVGANAAVTDGKVTATDIGGTGKTTISEAIAAVRTTANSSASQFKGDNDKVTVQPKNGVLNVKGGAKQDQLSDNNIGVIGDTNGTLTVKLAKELSDLDKVTVGTDQNKIELDGATGSVSAKNVTAAEKVTTKDLQATGDTTLGGQGKKLTVQNGTTINMGGNKITEVADGTEANDAVNFRQLTEVDNKAQAAQTTADNALAKANEGFKLQANGQDESTVTPGSIVNIKNGKNIQVTKDGNNITIATSDTPEFTSITTTNGATIGGKVTANELQTTNGATIGGKLTANQGLDVNGGNIAMNDGKITGLKAGEQNTDAVNKGQLDGVKTALETQLTNKTTEITNTLTNKGTKYQGDDNQTLSLRLGETLNIKGGVATNDLTTVDNIGVVKGQDDSTLNVKLAKDLKGLESVTTGTLTATGAITQGPNDKRIVINNGKITGLSETPTVDDDAANKKYVDDQNNKQNVGLKDLVGANAAVTDGKVTATDIGGTGKTTISEAIAAVRTTANSSASQFKGDNDKVTVQPKNGVLNVKGGAKQDQLSDNNIGVIGDTNGTLTVKLAKELSDLDKVTVGTDQNKIELDGATGSVSAKNVTAAEKVTTKDLQATGDTTLGGQGKKLTVQNGTTINMGGNKITEVADGTEANDAVNFRQLTEVDNKAQAAQTTADNALAKANEGFKLQANGQDESTVTPGSIVNIKNGKNIQVTKDGNNITIATSDTPEFTSITTTNGATIGGKVTANELQTTNGATIGGKLTANQGLDVNGGNIAMNDGKITGLKAGEEDADAVNKGQLDGVKTDLETQLTNKTTEITNTLTNKGLDFKANEGEIVHRNLGETLTIRGSLENGIAASSANIRTKTHADGTIEILMADKPKFTDLETDTLKVKGNAEIDGNQTVGGNQTVRGNQEVDGNSHIKGDQAVDGNLNVKGNADIQGSQRVGGDQQVDGDQTVKGDQTVEGDVLVQGDHRVEGDSYVQGNQTVDGNSDILGNQRIGGDQTVDGNSYIKGDQEIDGDQTVKGNQHVEGNQEVDGNSHIKGDQAVDGNLNVKGNADIQGSQRVGGDQQVDGDQTVKGDQTVEGDVLVQGDHRVEGDSYVQGNQTVDGNSDILGNQRIGGDQTVDGNSYIKGDQEIDGDQTVAGDVLVQGDHRVEGDSYVQGNQTVDGNSDILGNQRIGGDQIVDGNSYIKGDQEIDGDQTVKKDLTVEGNTTLGGEGKSFTVKNGTAINMGANKVSGVADGDISAQSTDAVNGSQFYHAMTAIDSRLNDVDFRMNNMDRNLRAGIAGSNAAAALPQAIFPSKSMLAVSGGTFRGQSALAIGYSTVSDSGKTVFKMQGNANTQGHVGASVGVGIQW